MNPSAADEHCAGARGPGERALRLRLLALATVCALAGCGGGGTTASASTPAPATSTSATLTVDLVGGASPGIDHLWVTVTGVAMHADATEVYGDGDPGWVTVTLATPVTVDLASSTLSQGGSALLLSQAISNTGTYQQLRLLLAPPDGGAGLLSTASAQGLTWNDQVQYTDADGAHVVPLEIPDVVAGLRLQTGFSLSADSTTPLSVEWNARSSLVRRASTSGSDRFALRDELQLYNQSIQIAGDELLPADTLFNAITGQLDTSQFCTGSSQSNCIHDVVASAMLLTADERFHEEVRSVNVSSSGSFTLYPLPGTVLYDVVIHGVNMRTFVVRNVPVDPTGLAQPEPTILSTTTTPLVPVLDTTGQWVTLGQAMTPAAGRVLFGITIPGSGSGTSEGDLPYAIDYGAADPATGLLVNPVWLPGGPVLDAAIDSSTFQQGTPPTFTAITPAEGVGGYTVWSEGREADSVSATSTLAAGASSVVPPAPALLTGFAGGTITVTLAGTPTNAPDHAELIVTDDLGTVSVTDVSSLIATGGGSVQVAVPSGQTSSTASASAAVYGLALRTWKASSEISSALWARSQSATSLETATTATASLNFP